MFFQKFWNIFQNNFYTEHLEPTASWLLMVVQGRITTLNYIHAFGSNQFSFILLLFF